MIPRIDLSASCLSPWHRFPRNECKRFLVSQFLHTAALCCHVLRGGFLHQTYDQPNDDLLVLRITLGNE